MSVQLYIFIIYLPYYSFFSTIFELVNINKVLFIVYLLLEIHLDLPGMVVVLLELYPLLEHDSEFLYIEVLVSV